MDDERCISLTQVDMLCLYVYMDICVCVCVCMDDATLYILLTPVAAHHVVSIYL